MQRFMKVRTYPDQPDPDDTPKVFEIHASIFGCSHASIFGGKNFSSSRVSSGVW